MKIRVSARKPILAAAALALGALANPSTPVVVKGSAKFSTTGPVLTIHTSTQAAINWKSFNIGLHESTIFVQPSSTSLVLNRISDPNPSQILGHLTANGFVVLENQNGFYIGGQAAIQASGLILSTAHAMPIGVFGSGAWDFIASPPSASIINYGQIQCGEGGAAFLIARDIQNHGEISAPGGKIGLYAGKEVLVSTRPDGLGVSAQVKLPEGSVDNSGNLIADAGTIALHAQVVNQGGMIQANSVRQVNGVIEVVASDTLNLGSASVIEAKGDSHGVSDAGKVTLKSGNTFSDEAGSTISVAGGAHGGDGGNVEISAPSMAAIHSTIDGHATKGFDGGGLLIDPALIKIDASGPTTPLSGSPIVYNSAPTTLTLNPGQLDGSGSAFTGFKSIDLQATGQIQVNSAWRLPASTGISDGSHLLTLESGGDIVFNANAGITGSAFAANGDKLVGKATGWSVTLEAGRNFAAGAGVVKAGTGSVTLSSSSYVETENGAITILAGKNVSIAGSSTSSAGIRTLGGGSINVESTGGNVTTGNNVAAYNLNSAGSYVSQQLGGISTAAGGDVTITADKGSVTSYLPAGNNATATDAGSGAFGSQPGVVTVTAYGDITGHFVAANSSRGGKAVASTIKSLTGNAGTKGAELALSLVKGGWDADAPLGSIYLQEVRNPNGALIAPGNPNNTAPHVYNYGAKSFVDLEAPTGGVTFAGDNVPRDSSENAALGAAPPVIYPPILTIDCGSAGVAFLNDVTLFPSPYGNLTIKTTGPMEGNGHTLAMSDAGYAQWTGSRNFATDHAAVPVHLYDGTAAKISVGGEVNALTIDMPKKADITVGGDMKNSKFDGQNLHVTDATSITVKGAITEESPYTLGKPGNYLPLPAPFFAGAGVDYLQVLLNAVLPGSGPNSPNGGKVFPILGLFYLPVTGQLGYYGDFSSATAKLMEGTLQQITYYPNGKPILDSKGNYVTALAKFAGAWQIAGLQKAAQNTGSPASDVGYFIGGPGTFNITAKSIDLGSSGGINSQGPQLNPHLVNYTPKAADINVIVTGGDLDMFASQITDQFYGGNIFVDVQNGAINAGLGSLPFTAPGTPFGIWTAGLFGNVTVIAKKDINVDGARIAAFDGGNVFVESLTGNVDAGSGGAGQVNINVVTVLPDGSIYFPQEPINASGILTSTFQDASSDLSVGNITVWTPEGDINASFAGIAQIPQNGNTSLLPGLTLTAGTRAADGAVIHKGNINAGNSGVIGVNTYLNAAGNISGLFIAQFNSTINAAANVSGTFLTGGTASFNAGGTISGLAIAGQGLNVGSGTFTGVALAQNATGAGVTSALASTATASSSSQGAAAQSVAAQKSDTSDALAANNDEDIKKAVKRPLLAKYTGRVTVILPKQ